MGKGRKKKPAVLKKGNSESKAEKTQRAAMEKRLMGNDDQVYVVPDYLNEMEQVYYKFLTTELKQSGIIGNLDIDVIEQTAICLSDMRTLGKQIKCEGIIIEQFDRSGNKIKKENPAFTAKQKLLKEFRAFSALLGLNPSSRASLASAKIEAKDEAEDPLLKALRGDDD